MLPVQNEALVEDQVRVDDCPELIFVGLADKEAVVGGGGVMNEPTVQGVNEPWPQQVPKASPFAGSEGFDVSPAGSCMMTPLFANDRFGF